MLFRRKRSDPSSVPAGRLQEQRFPARSALLRTVSLERLGGEFLARFQDDVFTSESTILLGCEIQDALRSALDIHGNRTSKQYHLDLFGDIYHGLGPLLFDVEDATIVDVGCGSINPFGLLFMFLMLGARRGIAIDPDEIQDLSTAVRTLADSAGLMLTAPATLVDDCPVRPEEVLRNIASFDLARMTRGDFSGIDRERLRHQRESVCAISLQDGEADLVISNSFLEHVESVHQALAELARITRHQGLGVHRIDGSDHRRYLRPGHHPLQFLSERDDLTMVHECNRIRPYDFVALFEEHGFEVLAVSPDERIEITADLRNRFAEPFRSQPDESLGVLTARLIVRRCDSSIKTTTSDVWRCTDSVTSSQIKDAWKLIADGSYSEAIAGLLEIPESHPKHYYATALCGFARYCMNDFEGAESDLARALELTRRRPEAFLYRAWLRLAQDRIEEGAQDALRAQELVNRGHGLEAEVLNILGLLYSRQGRHQDAMGALDRLLALQPKRTRIHVHRGSVFQRAGRRDEALAEVETALALDPSDEQAFRLKEILLSDPA